MFIRLLRLAKVGNFLPIYLANIFLSLHYAAILYVNSTFLGKFFDPSMVSLLFLLAAVLNVILFLLAPRILITIGLRITYLLSCVVAGLALIGMAFSEVPNYVAAFFVIYAGVLFVIYYCLDIFLEAVSIESKTGGIRGLYLTLGNAAIAAGPLLLPLLVLRDELAPIYLAALILLVPAFILGMFFRSPHRADLMLGKSSMTLPFSAWWQASSVRRATLARLVLEIFYAIMIIYTPIYLFETMGFEWGEIGIIFTIMLLPFIIFEWPMGELADRMYGEKEIMSIGFFITGCSLLLMPFLGPTFVVWATVLFISRIGASFIEIATESHFFKYVDARDSALISIFRLSRPVGLMAGALLGVATLQLFSIEKIFLVLAVVVFLGLKESLYLEDTL